MTGYGRAEKIIDGREITVELRAVNNRYLDLNVKLPRVYGFAEDAVKSLVKANVNRGKLDMFIAVNVTEDTSVKIALNKPVLEGYLAALKSIASDYGVRDDISVTALSRMPDVFVIEKQEEDEQKLTEDILSVVKEALAKFNAMREKEGAAMEADLRSRAKTVLALVEKVEARSPVTLAEYRARLTEKMQEVLGATNIDESRILQEAAVYADKIAVDEETVRLRSHLNQLDQMLTTGGPIGRKLDFLLQEFNRESNTIGSKGNDLEQARTVADLKAELEKIREQTQHIEQPEADLKLISIGFGNAVAAARILAVVSPDSAPIKRVVQEARERGMLLDASFGRRTKSVLLMDTDHVILSSVTPETICARMEEKSSEEANLQT